MLAQSLQTIEMLAENNTDLLIDQVLYQPLSQIESVPEIKRNLVGSSSKRSLDIERDGAIVITEQVDEDERKYSRLFVAHDEWLTSTLALLKSSELSFVAKCILTKLSSHNLNEDMFMRNNRSQEDAISMFSYTLCFSLPPRAKQAMYEAAFLRALKNYFPNIATADLNVASFLDNLDNQVIYSDLVEFMNEDVLSFVISNFGKFIMAKRLTSPKESLQLVKSHLIGTKLFNLLLCSLLSSKTPGKVVAYDIYCIERAKLLVEEDLSPQQALLMLLFNFDQLHFQVGEVSVRKLSHILEFTKFIFYKVDRDTFEKLTQNNLSIDLLFTPFLLSNFSVCHNSKKVLRFWELQMMFCHTAQGEIFRFDRNLSAYHLLQVWLLLDSLGHPSFQEYLEAGEEHTYEEMITQIKKAVTKSLDLDYDEMLYSMSNFLNETLSKNMYWQNYTKFEAED
jgi:hypothetical protein